MMKAQNEITCALVEQVILAHPFFRDINPRHIHLLTDCASSARFGMGQDVFQQGQDADYLYLIAKGQVALETFVPRLGSTRIQIVGPGEALGCSWLYPPYRWQFSARAIDPVEAVALSAASLRHKAQENHDFGYDVAMRLGGVLLQRLQNTRRQLVEFYVRGA